MKTRVVSAVILGVITVACLFLSPYTRILFFMVMGGLCAYEFSKSVEKLGARCTLWVMFVYLGAQCVLVLLDAGLFAYCVCFVGCIYLALFSGIIHKRVAGKGALFTLAGLTYPCVLFGIMMDISLSDIWMETLVIAFFASASCDIFALLGGSRFGKHKLAPSVSPKKTVEGSICGAAASVVFGAAVWFILGFLRPVPLPLCLITSLVASTAGQVGDLSESLLKRMIGVKDFSNLIPGHGGVFDRADSLLFAIPSAYFCLLVDKFLVHSV